MRFFVIASALVAAVYAEAAAEAEAEADPGLYYAGYGYPYAYGFGKSAPCVNAANVPVPCAAGYAGYAAPYGYGYFGRKRREAEPTAAAEADPALLYSAYGYPYAYAYAAGAYPYAAAPLAYAAPAPAAYALPPTQIVNEAPVVEQVVEPVEQWGYKVAY